MKTVSFLVALVSSAVQAVRLVDYAGDGILTYQKPSEVQGPESGFPSEGCGDVIPAEFADPVCYEGDWIEYAWLQEPDFWACGAKPRAMDNPVCNQTTGKWETYVKYDAVDDAAVCGERPETEDYVVCNHETSMWETF